MGSDFLHAGSNFLMYSYFEFEPAIKHTNPKALLPRLGVFLISFTCHEAAQGTTYILSVGIPFIESTEINSATNTITDIVESVAASAPSEGDSVNLNISDFTLQNVVPKKPYFTYTSDTDNTQWIVFGLFDAIPLSKTTLGTLSQLINPFNIATTGGDLFYNSKGPNIIGAGEGIYISCQPTGSSDEETSVSYTTDTTSYDIFNNKNASLIIQIIVWCIIFVILFFILNYAYTYLISDETHLKMNNYLKRNS